MEHWFHMQHTLGNDAFETIFLLCFSGKKEVLNSFGQIHSGKWQRKLSFSPILNYHHLRLWD